MSYKMALVPRLVWKDFAPHFEALTPLFARVPVL